MARPAWLDAPTTAKIGSGLFLVVESPADPFIERMEDEPNLRDRLFLATRALRHDPGCIEAHLLLAEYAARFHQRMAHIGKAVATGAALWGPVVKRDNDFAWWGVSATRPYMRAIEAAADMSVEMADYAMATKLHGRLLRMNPFDNQGIRYKVDGMAEDVAPGM
jgi:hypothetical protein